MGLKKEIAGIVLPLPPSLNHSYITTKQGKRIMTDECRNYKEKIFLFVKGNIRKPYPKLANIRFSFYWPDNRKRDTDNALKILKDCLKGALVADDSWQCLPWEVIKSSMDKKNPRVEVYWRVGEMIEGKEDNQCQKP